MPLALPSVPSALPPPPPPRSLTYDTTGVWGARHPGVKLVPSAGGRKVRRLPRVQPPLLALLPGGGPCHAAQRDAGAPPCLPTPHASQLYTYGRGDDSNNWAVVDFQVVRYQTDLARWFDQFSDVRSAPGDPLPMAPGPDNTNRGLLQ